jgi:hypothetical protein
LGKCVSPEDNLSYFSSSINGSGISTFKWDISGFSKTIGQKNDEKLKWREAFLTLPNPDSFQSVDRPILQSLYKAIPSEKAEQLLQSGYSEDEAIALAVTDYIDNLSDPEVLITPKSETVKTHSLNDLALADSTLDYSQVRENTLIINAVVGNDTIDLGGDLNSVTVNLNTGNNIVNLDTSGENSEFYINTGTGSDVINLSGKYQDYSLVDNGDSTYTATNAETGTMVTFDTLINEINFDDGSRITHIPGMLVVENPVDKQTINIETDNTSYQMNTTGEGSTYNISGDANTLVLTGTEGNEIVDITGVNNQVQLDLQGGNDLLSIDGTNNNVIATLYDRNDRVYVYTGNANTVDISGGNYSDTVILEGLDTDWTFDGTDTYTHNTSGTSVKVDSVELIKFAAITDDVVDTSTVFDLTANVDTTEIINAGNLDDTIILGGSGNDITANLQSGDNTVTIDDALYNNFVINGGTGTDSITFTGNIADYTFKNNQNGTLTLTNTTSLATTTIDTSVENITFAAGSTLSFDEENITIQGSIYDDAITIDGESTTYNVNAYNGNDTINVDGTNITANLYLHNDDDSVYVAVGDNNTIAIDGAHGVDTLTLQGNFKDWTHTGTGVGSYYTHVDSGTKVTLLTSIDTVAFDDGLVIFDDTTTPTGTDATGYNNTTVNIHAGGYNDILYLGGTNNDVTVTAESGYNRFIIDDTTASTYDITGGTDTDVITLTGNYSDYTIVQNPDDTTTITNIASGATINFDHFVMEKVNFADISYETATGYLTAEGTNAADTMDLTALNNETLTVNSYAGDDLVNLGGTGNTTTVNLSSGYNTVNIDDSTQSDHVINAGNDTDVITLTGNIADYNIVDNGDGTVTLTNAGSAATITLSPDTVEKVAAADGNINLPGAPVLLEGTAGFDVIDGTGYNATTLEVLAYDGNDTVTLNGTGNNTTVHLMSGDNTVNIDDTTQSDYIINGGTGVDSINVTGNIADYNIADNGDGTLTLTNTISNATLTLSSYDVEHVYAFDGEIALPAPAVTINGTVNSDIIDATEYSNANITVNALASNDVINYSGANNTLTVNLNSGDNTVNLDDSQLTDATINGSTGLDIVNISGNMPDYTITNNGDGTFTLNNTLSGSTTTIDSSIDVVNFADGATLDYDSTTVALTDTLGASKTLDYSMLNNTNLIINGFDGDDTISLGGAGNDTEVNLNSGNNIVNIDDSLQSTYYINGGSGADVVNLSGNSADYTSVVNADDSVTITNTLTSATIRLSDVETVNTADGTVSLPIILEGTPNVDVLDATGYSDSTIIVRDYESNDTINLGGINNNVTLEGGSDNDTINIDDSNFNTFNISAGTGVDTVNLSGNASNYSFTDNGDTTLTLTNAISGATTTINSNVENVVFADSTSMAYSGTTLTLTDAAGNSSNYDLTSFNNRNMTVNLADGNDTLSLAGTGNTTTVNITDGVNTINIDDSTNSDYTIYGGAGNDTINITGNIADYALVSNPDGTTTLTNTISNATITVDSAVETLNAADGTLRLPVTIDGTPNVDVLDATGYVSSDILVRDYESNDTINLGGTDNIVSVLNGAGDDTININDSNYNEFTITGGTGTDTINLTGNSANYSFTDNGDGTLTLTNSISGATTTINSSIENVNFADGTAMTFAANTLTLTDTAGNASNFDLTSFDSYNLTVNLSDSNDTIALAGTGNTTTINATAGINTYNVDDSTQSTYNINGGADNDVLNVTGNIADYNVVFNSPGNYTITNTVTSAVFNLDSVDRVFAADGEVDLPKPPIVIDGTAGIDTLDATGYTNYNIVVNAYASDDTVYIGGNNNTTTVNLGSGNNQVYVDETNYNDNTINGGTGIDTINFADNLSNYTFTDNGDTTYTITNTASGSTTTIDSSVENLVFTDINGNSSTVNIADSIGAAITFNAGNNNDSFTLGGLNNDITVNLSSGTNTVNIDETNPNNFTVYGGTGADTVNFTSGISNYSFTDNGDNTLTITNLTSGTATTIDGAIENIVFTDGSAFTYDGTSVAITATTGVDTLNLTGDNVTYSSISLDNGNDVVTIGGSNNIVNIDSGFQNDSFFVEVGNNNTITLDGSNQSDTLTLEGAMADWTLVGSTYTHVTSGTSVTISNIESILFTI